VLAKRLARPNAVWAWYLARELAVYRAFAESPPPVRVPKLVGATAEILLIERFTGGPIARRRRPHARLPEPTLHQLIDAHARFATWPGTIAAGDPPPEVRTQLRRRLLEDPTAPVDWVRDGIARAGHRGIFSDVVTEHALAALAAHAPIAPSHGDLLLRNAFLVDGDVALVDWECAGMHVADWDLALLWAQLAPAGRAVVEAAAGDRAAFLALALFALAREVVFLEAFRAGPDHRGMIEVRADIAATAARLTGG
jgi:phosphotransferase family enzyme